MAAVERTCSDCTAAEPSGTAAAADGLGAYRSAAEHRASADFPGSRRTCSGPW